MCTAYNERAAHDNQVALFGKLKVVLNSFNIAVITRAGKELDDIGDNSHIGAPNKVTLPGRPTGSINASHCNLHCLSETVIQCVPKSLRLFS